MRFEQEADDAGSDAHSSGGWTHRQLAALSAAGAAFAAEAARSVAPMATGPHVRWMFAQRLAGRSVAGIARELTERGVPCPSEVDRRAESAPRG